jgi:hypothetical protein
MRHPRVLRYIDPTRLVHEGESSIGESRPQVQSHQYHQCDTVKALASLSPSSHTKSVQPIDPGLPSYFLHIGVSTNIGASSSFSAVPIQICRQAPSSARTDQAGLFFPTAPNQMIHAHPCDCTPDVPFTRSTTRLLTSYQPAIAMHVESYTPSSHSRFIQHSHNDSSLVLAENSFILRRKSLVSIHRRHAYRSSVLAPS